MVRTNQLLHPTREPVATRPAATVLLLRDTPQGIEVLMTRRSLKASFVPGAYVFPGGGVDAKDATMHSQSAQRATQNVANTTYALAAVRESFEELGVLLARRPDGSWCTQADVDALDRTGDFYAQCATQGFTLAADAVYVLAQWITDRDMPKRFDVAFLVARMPPGQVPVADEAEQFEPLWVRPADAVARQKAGTFFMIFPTIRTLERLSPFATVDAVLQACASEQPLWVSCPRAGLLGGAEERYMEGDAPFGELALVCPDGQILHQLDWQHEQPVRLLQHVQRLTASNPGVMTGPGTNTYIVGTAATGYIVIDPGPYENTHKGALGPAHVQRLIDATGGDIRAIVCTHSHADHSPAAQPLQALCANKPPILGLPSAPTANAQAQFTPDRVLQNKELLTLIPRALAGDSPSVQAEKISLQVVYTPGHAANHVCLVLVEDGLLLSGDHILNGSTTIINPPDGSMTAYLDALDALQAACAEHRIEFILPAHGYALGNASGAIAQLKAHRLKREAKVKAAMQALPSGDLDAWVPLAYDDTPQQLWPLAKRSMLAHVERLQELYS